MSSRLVLNVTCATRHRTDADRQWTLYFLATISRDLASLVRRYLLGLAQVMIFLSYIIMSDWLVSLLEMFSLNTCPRNIRAFRRNHYFTLNYDMYTITVYILFMKSLFHNRLWYVENSRFISYFRNNIFILKCKVWSCFHYLSVCHSNGSTLEGKYSSFPHNSSHLSDPMTWVLKESSHRDDSF